MHREYSWHIIKYAEFFRVKKKAQFEVTSSNQKLEELHEEDLVSLVVKSPEELWCYMVVVLKVREWMAEYFYAKLCHEVYLAVLMHHLTVC